MQWWWVTEYNAEEAANIRRGIRPKKMSITAQLIKKAKLHQKRKTPPTSPLKPAETTPGNIYFFVIIQLLILGVLGSRLVVNESSNRLRKLCKICCRIPLLYVRCSVLA